MQCPDAVTANWLRDSIVAFCIVVASVSPGNADRWGPFRGAFSLSQDERSEVLISEDLVAQVFERAEPFCRSLWRVRLPHAPRGMYITNDGSTLVIVDRRGGNSPDTPGLMFFRSGGAGRSYAIKDIVGDLEKASKEGRVVRSKLSYGWNDHFRSGIDEAQKTFILATQWGELIGFDLFSGNRVQLPDRASAAKSSQADLHPLGWFNHPARRCGPGRDVANLTAMLDSSRPANRIRAIGELGLRKEGAARSKLLSLALGDTDLSIRRHAAYAFVDVAEGEGTRELKPLLNEPELALDVALMMAEYGDKSAVAVLRTAISSEATSDRYADGGRLKSAEALADLGDRSGTEVLLAEIERPVTAPGSGPPRCGNPDLMEATARKATLRKLASLYAGTKDKHVRERLRRLSRNSSSEWLREELRQAIKTISEKSSGD